jgi:ribosomal protein L32
MKSLRRFVARTTLRQRLRRAHMDLDFKDGSQCENCKATWSANRAEHYGVTRSILRRHGAVRWRSGGLTERPNAEGAKP